MASKYQQTAIFFSCVLFTACLRNLERAPDALDCSAPGESYRVTYVVKSSTCWDGGETTIELSGTIPHEGERAPGKVNWLGGEPRQFEAVPHSSWHGCAVDLTDVETGVTCELSSAPLGWGRPLGPCLKDGEEAGCKFHMDHDCSSCEDDLTEQGTSQDDNALDVSPSAQGHGAKTDAASGRIGED